MPKLLTLLLAGAFCLGVQTQSIAQSAASFPSKPIKIIVPNAAGGAADITSREVGQKLAEAFGGSVVVENKPSAGGIVAGEIVSRAAPDGHTLLLVSSGTAVSAALFKSLPFDTLKDFTPVSKLASFDLVIASSDRGRFNTLADVLTYARANPGKLNIGTPQIGSTQNLAAELFKASAGIEAQLVPFNGTPPVISALRGGEIDIMVEILGPLVPQFNSKALRPLAVMSERRTPQFVDVPTVRESGGSLSTFNASSWNGFAAPAKTPKDVIAKLNLEIQKALKNPDVIKRLEALSLHPGASTPEALGELLASDIKRWGEVMARAQVAKQ
jgi:tripartite-type tricarboxylate transporter receptor subunit TctC